MAAVECSEALSVEEHVSEVVDVSEADVASDFRGDKRLVADEPAI